MTNQNASSTSARRGATGGADRGPRPVKWVSFVGSGPGDPGLLTVRALELLREAEIVITETDDHEQLVRSVLGLPARTETEGEGEPVAQVGPVFVDGGFGEDGQPLTHASRAKVVVRQAKTGKRVVRLMSGDPFLYASGPEEALACTKAEVGFEIVPGVSSITAVPAYAGIPLTTKNHREVAVVTCSDARIDWEAYATHPTLVLLSAVRSIGDIAAELISAGRAGDTPVSMTRTGTLTTQETIVSTLANIDRDATSPKQSVGVLLQSPLVIEGSATAKCFPALSLGLSWARSHRTASQRLSGAERLSARRHSRGANQRRSEITLTEQGMRAVWDAQKSKPGPELRYSSLRCRAQHRPRRCRRQGGRPSRRSALPG